MATEESNTDEDYFSLGKLVAGTIVEMNALLPSDSALQPRVQLVDASGAVVSDSMAMQPTGTSWQPSVAAEVIMRLLMPTPMPRGTRAVCASCST